MEEQNKFVIPNDMALFPTKYKKKRVNYTIGADLLHDFNTFCDEEALNRSAVIEKFILNFLIQNGIKKG